MIAFSAQQIAALLGGELHGNAQAMVSDVAPIESAEAKHLSFITEEKYLSHLATTQAGVVLVSKSLIADQPDTLPLKGNKNNAIIVVENARGAMAQLLDLGQKPTPPKPNRPTLL